MRIEMHNPVGQLLNELTLPGITQASAALTYAFIMRQEPNADWAAINAAICKRWKGRTALERVKQMAWAHLEASR